MDGRFLQFAADNLDILEETLDGKETFHVTQILVYQRSPNNKTQRLEPAIIARHKSLNTVPPEFHEMSFVTTPLHQVQPQFSKPLPANEIMSFHTTREEQKHKNIA